MALGDNARACSRAAAQASGDRGWSGSSRYPPQQGQPLL